MIQGFIDDETGATAVEYGLIAALVSVVIIVALTSLGSSISLKFSTVSRSVSGS